jgi:hypothetical protein
LALLILALAVSGCGSHAASQVRLRRVAGNGFSFAAPAEWKVTRSGRMVNASPSGGGPDLVSVQTFRLRRPAQWPRVIPEIDRVARVLTARLRGTLGSSRTVTVDGRRARQYEIGYVRFKTSLTQRITFVFKGRREYQLSCRWAARSPNPARRACENLAFRLQ